MSGFIKEVKPLSDCLDLVSESLGFTWEVPRREVDVQSSFLLRSACDVASNENLPAFTRSLRDGYALNHLTTAGASSGAPVFLRIAGSVSMGEIPSFNIEQDEVAAIPTGGMLPSGADSVVMIEDTAPAGSWVELRRAVQRGEHLMFQGEDVARGELVLERGELLDCPRVALLAALGITRVAVSDIKIGIVSTGDEIVSPETSPLPAGFVRDANACIIQSLLKQYGFGCAYYGIVPDDREAIAWRIRKASSECDVILVSGGSSVGTRDHTFGIIESMPPPGLLVRGINIAPGKPTLIGGTTQDKKMIMGLPGHPQSCLVACVFVVIPLLLRLIGAKSDTVGRYMKLRLGSDVQGRTGPDEFVPMRIENGLVFPIAAKSGYVSAMKRSDGFIRLFPNMETKRTGDEADIWIW